MIWGRDEQWVTNLLHVHWGLAAQWGSLGQSSHHTERELWNSFLLPQMTMCQLTSHLARSWVKKKHSWAKVIPLFCLGTIWPGWTIHSRAPDEVTGAFSSLHFPSSSKSSDRNLPSLLWAFGWRCSTARFPPPLCPWGRRWHLCHSPPLRQGPEGPKGCWEEQWFLRPRTLSHSLIGYQSLWPTPKTKSKQNKVSYYELGKF